MKILVFGSGGIGSVFGGFLARMGHEVSLLGRPWHMDAIEKEGLVITGLWGDYRIKAFELHRSVQEIYEKKPEFDLILLTVKSFDTRQAVGELLPLMNQNTTLVSFQNGLGNIEIILEKVKPEQFLVGRVIFGAECEPGRVRVTVSADKIIIGALPGVTPKLSAHTVAHLFNLSKLETQAVPNILTYIWSKVIYNCALNGICTIFEMPYGNILLKEDTREWMKAIVRECYAVGTKKGVALDPLTPEAYIEQLIKKLIPSTASHIPSMLQDIRKKKPIDIDALNGAICRMGEFFGVPTPENQRVVDAILTKAKKLDK